MPLTPRTMRARSQTSCRKHDIIDVEPEVDVPVETAEDQKPASKLDAFEAGLANRETIDAETGEVFPGDTPIKADQDTKKKPVAA